MQAKHHQIQETVEVIKMKGINENAVPIAAQPHICPKFEQAFSILGKRWSGLIIRTLADGPLRFSAIEEAIPSLSARMLSERCRELEDEGIIRRQVYPEKPVRIEYELTEKGHELDPALDMIQKWSNKWCDSEIEEQTAEA